MHASSGWYPDPSRPDTEHYWDGTDWTKERPTAITDLVDDADPVEAFDPVDELDRVDEAYLPGVTVRSTVGFELPSSEALQRMGAGASSPPR